LGKFMVKNAWPQIRSSINMKVKLVAMKRSYKDPQTVTGRLKPATSGRFKSGHLG
jgi:hypothetical protein